MKGNGKQDKESLLGVSAIDLKRRSEIPSTFIVPLSFSVTLKPKDMQNSSKVIRSFPPTSLLTFFVICIVLFVCLSS